MSLIFLISPTLSGEKETLDIIDLKNVQIFKEPKWTFEADKNQSEIFMHLLILSAPKNFEIRQEARDYIAGYREILEPTYGPIKATFLIGMPDNPDPNLIRDLDREHQNKGDILHTAVPEGYRNLA